MAFLECHYHSDQLGRGCTMNVIVPQKSKTQIGMVSSGSAGRCEYPVLYLLHGLSDDESIWMRRTSIERYASEYNLVVVMPDGGRGFYTDARQGDRYWSWLAGELPEIVSNLFPVSRRREDTFAAGLSMGGYGALKLALKRPDRFAGAAGLSSVADIPGWLSRIRKENPERLPEMLRIFGSEAEAIADGNDLLTLAESCRKSANLPRLYMACGTEDFLYADNRKLRTKLLSLDWPEFRYEEGPGTHSWAFWDQWIVNALGWLLRRN